jgi:outer membrane protein assembly factor BamB
VRLINRRHVLVGLTAGLGLAALVPAPASAAASSDLPVGRRWPTGNRLLAPAVAAGRLVVFGGDRTIGVLDSGAGGIAWKHDWGDGPGVIFRPRVADNVVVAGSGAGLAAWRLDDGRLLWRRQPEIRFGVPLLHRGRMYCGDGHRLVAFDTVSGKPQWSFAAIPDTLISYAPIAIGGTVAVGPGDGRLYALAAEDGRLQWSQDGRNSWQYLRQLHAHGTLLVVGAYQEKLHGIDIADGREVWSFYAGNFINSHLVADGTAYLWSPTGWLYAVDAATGNVRWRHRTTDYRAGAANWGPLMAELALSGRSLFALDMTNTLHVLDTGDGREVVRLKGAEALRPFVVPVGDDRVVLGTQGGDLLLAQIRP